MGLAIYRIYRIYKAIYKAIYRIYKEMYGKPDNSGQMSGFVRFSIHFFVNFEIFKRMYLAYVWVYLHQTWGFFKAWSARLDYVDQ